MASKPTKGAVLGAALVLAGCGSGDQRRVAPQPKLPQQVAAQLAGRSDQVAEALDAGDSCGALDEARRLQQDTIRAINAGRVPGAFQEHLGATASDLVARIECAPPADDEHGEQDKPKGKKRHGEDDD